MAGNVMHRRTFLQSMILGSAGGAVADLSAVLADPSESKPNDRAVIFIFLTGGLSHLDSFDPKPESPLEVRGEFGTVQTPVPGIRLSDQLPLLAQRFGIFALVRSIAHTLPIHDAAQRYVMTGDPIVNVQSPAIGAVAASSQESRRVPPYVAIPGIEHNAGELGPSCEPYNLLGDAGNFLAAAERTGSTPQHPAFADRLSLLENLNTRFRQRLGDRQALRVQADTTRHALSLLSASDLRHAADLSGEKESVRDSYGRFPLGEHLLMARRMVEIGARFVTVVAPGWDTHYEGFSDLRKLLPSLDRALAGLLDDLSSRGLLDRTTVLAMGDFGRTPRVNQFAGRDHWPQVGSALWAGGETLGGIVAGESDATGSAPRDEAYSPEDVAYTLLRRLNLRPESISVGTSGRKLLTGGKLITSLSTRT